MSSYIEEALVKARALAKQAKSRPSNGGGGGLSAAGEARAMQGPTAPVYAAPQMSRTVDRAQAEGRRLFLGGLSYETTDQSLETYLSAKWPTEEAKVKRDAEGKSRGFAFVTFPAISVLEDCFDAQPHWIDGKQVELRKVAPDGSSATAGQKRAAPGGGSTGYTSYGGVPPGTSTRVFIGQAPGGRSRGLNDDISDDDLRNYFERYGTVTGVAQHKWEDSGRKKGFGYMEFAEYEAAQAALGTHTVQSVMLEVKPYTQGGVKTVSATGAPPPSAPPPTYNSSGVSSDYGYGYGYGTDTKRSRADLPPQTQPPPPSAGSQNPAHMMEQMKGMMAQMQQMQQQMNSGSSMESQMANMQSTMYSMMQSQYMAALGGSSNSSYPGYPSNSQSYPTPPSSQSYPTPPSSQSYPTPPSYPSSQPYQYPSSIEYPKPPKPPGTDRY